MKFFPQTSSLFSLLVTFAIVANSLHAQQTFPNIAAALQPFVDKHELAGAVVAVAGKNKVFVTEKVGFADIAKGELMTEDSLFWIASMSKPITATAFMMLVDEGKVKMDDPVEKYLPEFKDQMVVFEQDAEHVLLKKPKQKVLLRHILSHTSGLAFKSAIETPTLDVLPLETRVRSYAAAPLQSEPGTKYFYSNEGINTAGRIIEVVSGMKYADFLQKRLFEPLGMTETTFWPSETQVKRLAKAYKPNVAKDNLEEITIGQLRYPLTDHSREPMPGGGLFSTAHDMTIFGQLLLNRGVHQGKRLLSEASFQEMTSRQTAEGIKESYGYGINLQGKTFGHGGALSTNLNIDPEHGIVTIFLVQHQGYAGNGAKSNGVFRTEAVTRYGNAVK